MNVVLYHKFLHHEAVERFHDNMLDIGLNYWLSDLKWYGLEDTDELGKAVERAMKICSTMNLPVRENFKKTYIYKDDQLQYDWRLSSLGKKLVLLNSDPSNLFVAKLQMKLME